MATTRKKLTEQILEKVNLTIDKIKKATSTNIIKKDQIVQNTSSEKPKKTQSKKITKRGYIHPDHIVKGLKPDPSNVLKKHSQGAKGNTKPLLTPIHRKHLIGGGEFSWENAIPEDFNRPRQWCLTIFQEKTQTIQFDEKQMQYMIVGSEICPTSKKHHFQCFVYFYNPKKFVEVRNYFYKRLGKYVHFNKCNGTNLQNIAYCSKDEDFTEHGKCPTDKHGGGNTPLKECIEQMKSGEITLKNIFNNNPDFYKDNRNVLKDSEMFILKDKKRTQRTTCDWFFGASGCGKTRLAENLAENNYTSYCTFNLNEYKLRRYVGYTDQECIIINDPMGDFDYNFLLDITDISKNFEVVLRGIGRIPFIPKHVFITSLKGPKQIFKKQAEEDKLFQLLRRINIYKLEGEHIIENNERIFFIKKILLNKAKEYEEYRSIITSADNSHIPYVEEI
jgi:hypothetical protein